MCATRMCADDLHFCQEKHNCFSAIKRIFCLPKMCLTYINWFIYWVKIISILYGLINLTIKGYSKKALGGNDA